MENNRRPEYYEDEVELIDYLRLLWRWKWVIALMVVICAGAAIGITMVKYPTKYITECIIALNFPGIEKHRNPDGTLFDKNQIITPAILSRAAASLQKEEVVSLREMIAIKAIIPPEVQEEIKKAEKRKESYAFFSNQFSLALATEQKDIFSEEEKSRILLSIVDEYRKEFERKYGEEPLVAINFSDDLLAKYDYGEVVDTFKTKIDTFIKFLDSKVKKAGFFRSQKTGRLSFIDIKSDAESLRNIELSKTEAIIGTLKLTKNKEDLINQYKYNIRKIEIRKRKKEKEASIAHRLLKEMRQTGRYELSKEASSEKGTSLVLDSSFIENLIKNDYFSSLLKTALKAEVEAKNLEVDKEFLEKKIIILKEKKDGKPKNIACVQKSLKTVKDEISILSQRANELNMEYLRRSVAGAVQVIKDPETFKTRSGNLKKTALLAAVVGLFFSIFLAFFIEYIGNASKAAQKGD